MGDISRHFSRSEIECRCGCGYMLIRSDLLHRLELVLSRTGFPMRISSWCRCPDHNLHVGGSSKSSHMNGEAVDIFYEDNHQLFGYLFWFVFYGFGRIKVYESHIHADIDPTKIYPWFEIKEGVTL